MPLHNYICTSGHVEKDVYFSSNSGGAKKPNVARNVNARVRFILVRWGITIG